MLFYKEQKMVIENVDVVMTKRIGHLRQMRDMTQEELARKLGVTQSAVCAWERGRAKPKESMIDDLCKALRVTREQFTGKSPVNYKYF